MTTLAIIHPTHLVAEEFRQLLETRPELWHELRLLAVDADEAGVLTEVRGAAAIISQLDESSLDGADIAFFFGSFESYRDVLASKPPATAAVLVAETATPPDALASVPLLGDEIPLGRQQTILSPHPVVVALSHLLWPLRRFKIRTAAATAIQPVSAFGKDALDELLGQARDLLSFSSTSEFEHLPATLAFNILQPTESPQLGDQLKQVLGEALGTDFQLAVQMLYGGVFHGLSLSVQIFLEDDPGSQEVIEALENHPSLDFAADPHLLGPKDVAGRDEILIGQVQSTGGGGYTLFAVLDNLTVAGSHNLLAIVERLLTSVH